MNHRLTTDFAPTLRAGLAMTAALALTAGTAAAQNVINSNTSIHSSLCVGFDCATTESFGADTIRLKENNLRIHFDDTSTSASYPNQDWRIEANSNLNGGGEYLRFIDATANPVTELHAVKGDTPTLRLDQNGSSGFQPQVWDLAGNETSFFIRDATNGSTLPFRIRPGASSNSLVIDTDDDIGVGVLSASASLHVRRTDGTAQLLVEEASGTASPREVARFVNNGRADVVIGNSDSNSEWAIAGGDTLRFRFGTLASGPAAKTQYMALTNTGDINIPGTITTGGSCSVGCDAVFTEDYDLPSIQEHAEAMYALGHLPNVGPTSGDRPFNLTDKLGRVLNELEHAHIYIAQQDARIADLTARLEKLESE